MQQNGKYGPEIDFAVKLDRRSGTVKKYVVKSYDDLDIENRLYGLKRTIPLKPVPQSTLLNWAFDLILRLDVLYKTVL